MDTRGKYESNVQRIGLSCDAFSTGCLIMCLLFFVPYVAENGGTLVMWFLPLACLVPFVVMPLVYMVIHKFDTVLFGRYHFVMPLAAFVAAPFFVMAWSAFGVGAAQSCLVFFGILIFAITIMVYRYCAFSVRARLTNSGIEDRAPLYEAFTALGCISAVAAFCGFLHYDSQTAYVNTAYVMGGLTVVLTLAQYLITFYDIPRLGGKRVQSVKSMFVSFYGELDTKIYLSVLFFEAAFACIAALLVYFGFALGVGLYGTIAVAATVIAVYGVSACVCSRRITRRSMTLSVIDIVCVTLSAAVLTVLAALGDKGDGTLAGLIIAAVIVGFGGAVAVRQSKLRFLTVKPRVTTGTVFILSELTMFAAAGIALFVAAIVATVIEASTYSTVSFIFGFGIAVLLAVAAFVLCARPPLKRSGSSNGNEVTRTVLTSDVDSYSQNS
ncbi:MAG: hypothetical protein K2O04_03700 [Clostridiales bacterium]|nr:hypothetical protein [Clostridiales bacterium]